MIDQGIRFKEHVGVIQINELTIEVLPKIDREDNDSRKWHDLLLDMLKECRILKPRSTGYANLKLKSNSVLKLYFEKYIAELEALIHQGLIKRYRTEEGNQSALKGRLVFSQHIQQNLIRAERFYTSHTLYDQNHYIHQILLQALEVVNKLSEQTHLIDRINVLLLQWPKGKHLNISEGIFNTIPVNRKTLAYQEALLIARMILLNYHPDLRGGRLSVLALMFNMNDLWEEFIFRRFKAMEKAFNWNVTAQKRLRYWYGDSGSKKLIPDILIECKDTGKRIIIDTKWKRPSKNKPDDHDLRQLFSYKLYYEGDSAYLLYPCIEKDGYVVDGSYHNESHWSKHAIFAAGGDLTGGLIFLNVIAENKLLSTEFLIKKLSTLLSIEQLNSKCIIK
ncbi:McrC family protein [Mucilaginibacter sp.]